MIKRKELREMVHEGKDLKSFVVYAVDTDVQCGISIIFRKVQAGGLLWKVHAIVDDGNGDKDTLIEFAFQQHSPSMRVETVAAQGIFELQSILESQVQSRQVLLSKLYEMTSGM